MNLQIPTWIAGLLACGMGSAFIGSVKIPLAQRLEIDEARVGGLVSMFGFAMIPVMLAMGFLTDLLDKQYVVVGGSILIAASLVTFARSTRYWSALVAVLLLSAGWSALINVLNVLMQKAFGGEPTFAMNMGNFFFGVGAFATPLVIALLLQRVRFAPALFILAAFSLLAGVLALGVDFHKLLPAAEQGTDPGIGMLLTDRVMWLTALALLFYAPMEATMAAWATTYLVERGIAEGRAATLLSGFWLTFTLSRLAMALIVASYPLPAGGDTRLIIFLAILCIAAWGGTVLSRGRAMAGAVVVLTGLVFGPTFPTIVGVLTGHVERDISPLLGGRAVGLFFMVGGVGWSIIPMLIGIYARKTSIQRAFLIAVAAAVGLTATALVLHTTSGGGLSFPAEVAEAAEVGLVQHITSGGGLSL